MIPTEIALTELQIEWGLTTAEFEKESIQKIMSVLEFREARAKGENAKSKSKK
jgi:hypothetical protein